MLAVGVTDGVTLAVRVIDGVPEAVCVGVSQGLRVIVCETVCVGVPLAVDPVERDGVGDVDGVGVGLNDAATTTRKMAQRVESAVKSVGPPVPPLPKMLRKRARGRKREAFVAETGSELMTPLTTERSVDEFELHAACPALTAQDSDM